MNKFVMAVGLSLSFSHSAVAKDKDHEQKERREHDRDRGRKPDKDNYTKRVDKDHDGRSHKEFDKKAYDRDHERWARNHRGPEPRERSYWDVGYSDSPNGNRRYSGGYTKRDGSTYSTVSGACVTTEERDARMARVDQAVDQISEDQRYPDRLVAEAKQIRKGDQAERVEGYLTLVGVDTKNKREVVNFVKGKTDYKAYCPKLDQNFGLDEPECLQLLSTIKKAIEPGNI
jgi:hypothetical protein